MRCAIYLRISDDPTGQQAGVDRQRDACEALAEHLVWEVAETFVDNDISAFSGKRRPGFEDLLVGIQKGRFTGLVVWHVDRLYRDLKDLERLIDVAEVAGVMFETVNSGSFDLTSSAGKMMARILGSVARQESEHHAERRREANRRRAVSGEWRREGSRPFGYDKTGVPLEPEATMLRTAAKDILGGRSLKSIAKEWNASGVMTVRGVQWTNLHVRRVLMNARIAALRVHQGKVIGPGTWEPILDGNTFNGLTAFLSDPSRKNAIAFERRHLLSGVARCGYRSPDADPEDPDSICGRRLYGSWPHGKDRDMVYTCRPVQHIGRVAPPVDRLVSTIIVGHLAEGGVGTDLANQEKVDTTDLSAQRKALLAMKSNLATLMRKGVLDMADVERESAIINKDVADLDKQIADATAISPVAMMLAEDDEDLAELLADVDRLVERWLKSSNDVKGKIINHFLDIVVLPAPRGVRTFDPDLIEIRWK